MPFGSNYFDVVMKSICFAVSMPQAQVNHFLFESLEVKDDNVVPKYHVIFQLQTTKRRLPRSIAATWTTTIRAGITTSTWASAAIPTTTVPSGHNPRTRTLRRPSPVCSGATTSCRERRDIRAANHRRRAR